MSYPALQLETSQTKRIRFSQKYKSDGLRLAALLREQQKSFPRFASQLDRFISQITSEAQRTRDADREKVLSALREFPDGLQIGDITEDTGLSSWDVRQVLDGLMKSGKVIRKPERRPRLSPACWHYLYILKR